MMESLWNGHWLPLDGRGMTYGSGHGVDNLSYPSKKACLADRQSRLGLGFDPASLRSLRCVPYNDSYTDPDDPTPWMLKFLFHDGQSDVYSS